MDKYYIFSHYDEQGLEIYIEVSQYLFNYLTEYFKK